ncbi:MAG TPA: 6-phosphogluconolactonase [Candidatus Methylacidiphilales bacterium]|nr:6-phosphogluconolactonase [Candidatus Methylacidiphilales bacterium]
MSEESRYVYPTAEELAAAAAFDLTRLAQRSVVANGLFTIALSGGSTPRALYTLMATDPAYRNFPWDKTHLFFGDERHVPPNHPDSNYLMVKNSLLSAGLVPEANVHRIHGELPDAHQAAADYDVEMRTFFTEDKRLNGFPRFDVILLGMGPDGHTASLFPGSKGLEEKERWVIANPIEQFKRDRITFTYPVLNSARIVYLLVAGPDKTTMLYNVWVEYRHKPRYPVQFVQPVDGMKIWLMDKVAAQKLPPVLT